MLGIVPLFAVVALVSLQCPVGTSGALLENRRLEMDNDLLSDLSDAAPKPRLRKYVHIAWAPPAAVRVAHGKALELRCEIYGSPSPSVAWLRNGHLMFDSEEEANQIFASHPSSLGHLTAKFLVSMPRNGDVYTCLAAAGSLEQSASTTIITDGEEEVQGNLLTLDRLLRVPSKPLITIYYDELFQDIGTTVILPCRVQSMAKTQVYWMDSDKNLVFGDIKFRVLPSGDLVINNLQWSDMGIFTCTAKNGYGTDTAETFIYPTKP